MKQRCLSLHCPIHWRCYGYVRCMPRIVLATEKTAVCSCWPTVLDSYPRRSFTCYDWVCNVRLSRYAFDSRNRQQNVAVAWQLQPTKWATNVAARSTPIGHTIQHPATATVNDSSTLHHIYRSMSRAAGLLTAPDDKWQNENTHERNSGERKMVFNKRFESAVDTGKCNAVVYINHRRRRRQFISHKAAKSLTFKN